MQTGQTERIYMVCWSCAVLGFLALLWYLGKALWPYIALVGEVFSYLLVTCAVSLFLFICAVTYHGIRILSSKANRTINNERLIVHGEVVAWLNDDGSIYHLSAVHESAKISAYAMQLDSERQHLQAELNKEHVDISEDSMAVKINNLATQHMSERKIVDYFKEHGIQVSRTDVKKALGRPH